MKNKAIIEKLKKYLRRNKPYIPCYAIRKELVLRNSSNVGEKADDLIVSARWKHNGITDKIMPEMNGTEWCYFFLLSYGFLNSKFQILHSTFIRGLHF